MWAIIKNLIFNEKEEDTNLSNDESSDDDNCFYDSKTGEEPKQIGEVTAIASDHLLINNTYFFPLDLTNYTNFIVGQAVSFHLRNGDVKNLKKLDEINNYDKEKSNEIIEKRVISGKVISKMGHELNIEPDISCDLSKVEVNFGAVIGDWVSLEIDETDKIYKIQPLRSYSHAGYITDFNHNNKSGVIDSKISFNIKVCEPLYVPKVGHRVIAEVIESDQKKFKFRATSVTSIFAYSFGDNHRIESSLLENKNGVEVTNNCIKSVVKLGDNAEFVITVLNGSSESRYIESISPACSKSGNIVDIEEKTYPVVVEAGQSIAVKVSVITRHLGHYSELIILSFIGDFKIGVLLKVYIEDVREINNRSENVSVPHRRNRRYTRRNNYGDSEIVRGENPIRKLKFIPQRISPHPIPDWFQDALYVDDVLRCGMDLRIAVENIVPYIKDEITYENYIKKLDAFLYLEEIEENVRVSKFNQERARFINRGQFLVLQIPNYCESSTSLCLGSKLIASELYLSQHTGKRISYEGFIHKIDGNDIYLKFNASFHNTHAGRDHSIRFIVNRSLIDKRHYVIRLVLNDDRLGRKCLFPELTENAKPPLLEIIGELPPPTDDDSELRSFCKQCRLNDNLVAKRNDDFKEDSTSSEPNVYGLNKENRSTVNAPRIDYALKHQQLSEVNNNTNTEDTDLSNSSYGVTDGFSVERTVMTDQNGRSNRGRGRGRGFFRGNFSNSSPPNNDVFSKHVIRWFNEKLNKYQKNAIRNILRGECRPLPYIIFGPPGTGKTVTVVELILQLWRIVPNSRLLICAPCNSSVNILCEQLIRYKVLKPGELVRLVGFNYISEHAHDVSPSMIPYFALPDLNEEDCVVYERKIESVNRITGSMIGRHRITLSTCETAAILHSMNFRSDHFSHVICDEAGRAAEPEIMLPLGLLSNDYGRAILVGDPQQLGPMVLSRISSDFGCNTSYISRLLKQAPYTKNIAYENTCNYNPRFVTMLQCNYRSVPEITNLYSSMFYDSNLISMICPKHGSSKEFTSKFMDLLPNRFDREPPSVLFHGIQGISHQDVDGSWYNLNEISQITYYLTALYHRGVSIDDIGIITPYRMQTRKIRAVLSGLKLAQPKIASVEEFQGQERNLIILSTVRGIDDNSTSNDEIASLGFVSVASRINVSISRAKYFLLIVGNPKTLAINRNWKALINYCIENDSYVGCKI